MRARVLLAGSRRRTALWGFAIKRFAMWWAVLAVVVGGWERQSRAVTPSQGTSPATSAAAPSQGTAPGWQKEISFGLGRGVKLEMVLIPAGEFLMGSPDSDEYAFVREKPTHRVRITKPFYLGKYLVTQDQWTAVMGNNPSYFKAPKNPVEMVSWDDCQKFLKKLREKCGRACGEFRLPTEAEWEYAGRAGSTTRYCYGNDESQLGHYAWYGENSGMKTHPVGEKKPNVWGLYDMHGNVWEWCADWDDAGYYAKSPMADPPGSATGLRRVNRGGCWRLPAWDCRTAIRHGSEPSVYGYGLGLRVSLVPADK